MFHDSLTYLWPLLNRLKYFSNEVSISPRYSFIKLDHSDSAVWMTPRNTNFRLNEPLLLKSIHPWWMCSPINNPQPPLRPPPQQQTLEILARFKFYFKCLPILKKLLRLIIAEFFEKCCLLDCTAHCIFWLCGVIHTEEFWTLKNLGEVKNKFENIITCLSVDQMVSNHEKIELKISRFTPLRKRGMKQWTRKSDFKLLCTGTIKSC